MEGWGTDGHQGQLTGGGKAARTLPLGGALAHPPPPPPPPAATPRLTRRVPGRAAFTPPVPQFEPSPWAGVFPRTIGANRCGRRQGREEIKLSHPGVTDEEGGEGVSYNQGCWKVPRDVQDK